MVEEGKTQKSPEKNHQKRTRPKMGCNARKEEEPHNNQENSTKFYLCLK
jgi:hypothetical protein